jgi:hypothetical protein
MTTKTRLYKVPFHGGYCYACGVKATGLRDRRLEGGHVEAACPRHADPRIPTYCACVYCDGPVRKGSITIDADFAHAKCHVENRQG